MFGDNKQIRDVADVAARIMAGLPPLQEKLHPNQQKIDVHEPEKDELTADDFKKLRAGKKPDVKKEEVEIEEESHQSKTDGFYIDVSNYPKKIGKKETRKGLGPYTLTSFQACRHPFRPFQRLGYFLLVDQQ